MGDCDSRFEFRVWGEDLSATRIRLQGVGTAEPPRESEETYILSLASDAANVKIRDGQIDIKQLVEVRGGLERWKPTLKSHFPIDARVVVEQVIPALGAAPPRIGRLALTLEQFLREVVNSNPGLRAIEVAKTRLGFEIDGCIAEYADVRIPGGSSSQTVALESVDPQAIRGAIMKLGLGSLPNVNYIRFLKLHAGFTNR